MGAFEEGNVEEGCLFERAEDLGQEYAQCVKHERKCRVPHAEVVIAGTSCKDLSRANPTNHKGKQCKHCCFEPFATTTGASMAYSYEPSKYRRDN